MTREEAWNILSEYTKTETLLKHALAVEAAMAYYAKHFQQDETTWRVVGLLHDFDYEQFPQYPDHPLKGAEILAQKGLSEELIMTIRSHVPDQNIPRNTLMRKALFAVDELVGFIIAVALVKPSKKLADVTPSSIRKKMKDKAFARAVNRDDIIKGAQDLGIELETHFQHTINALSAVAQELNI